MGTKMAPAYANIFMGNIEKGIQGKYNDKILIWKRFINDIFLIWTGDTTDFLTHINSIHSTIKFTSDISLVEITFLDVVIYKGINFQTKGILDLRTIKRTNKELYVHAKSYHPPSTKKSDRQRRNNQIPKNELLRKYIQRNDCKTIHKT